MRIKVGMNELALFAGVGGGLLASKLAGDRIVCYVEWNKYCVEVLKARIRDGYLDDAPIWDDCNTFDGHPWAGHVDCISAGFPCQPFSTAGKRLGELDPRNGWPATIRIIGEVRPAIIKLENVPGLLSNIYIRRIFGDLAGLGYDAEWGCLSAAAVGAPHLRNRLWIIAYTKSIKKQLEQFTWQEIMEPTWDCLAQPMADTDRGGFQGSENIGTFHYPGIRSDFVPGGEFLNSGYAWAGSRGARAQSPEVRNSNPQWWQVEPGLGRVADRVPHRVDRLAAIGNGQVPAVALRAYELLIQRMNK